MKTGNRYLKIAGIVLAIIVVLFASFFALAKIVITPERVKKTVLPLAEKALHRQVQLGDVKIGIFSGIVLNDLAIMEKEGSEPFIKAGSATLKYQFLPLLSKRIIVDEIRIDSPSIRVIRMEDHSFNYSDILSKKEPKEKTSADVDLLVSKMSLSKGELIFEDRSEKKSTPFRYSLTDVEFSSNDIALDRTFPFNASAKVTGASLALEGKVANLSTKPTLDANFRLTDADLKKIVSGLPPGLTVKIKSYDPAGIVNVKLHLAGAVAAPKELLKNGELELKDVTFNLPGAPRPVLAGKMTLKGSESSGNFTLGIGEDKLQISLAASNMFAKPVTINSDVKSERFDLVRFIGKKDPPAAAGAKPESGPLNLPVRATGSIQIAQTSYKGLAVTGLNLKYKLADNVLTVDQLSGNVAGGSFSDTARIDLGQKGFSYSTRLKLQGVQADRLVTAFSPKAAGKVFGTLGMNAELSGKGTQSDTIKKNLGGSGDFNFSNGRLTGSDLVIKLSQFLNLEQLRTIHFNSFAGKFRVEKGRVILDSGITGSDIQITPKGSAGFDKTLDLSLTTRLSPQLAGRVARGEAGKFFTDDKGWGVVPIKVGGTFSSPKYSLDTSAVTGQIRTKAREKLQQTIEEKFLKKKEGEPKSPEQNLLEKGLKGIFGK